MERVNRSHKKKDLDAHIKAEAQLLERNAIDAPVQDVKWDVKNAEVHADVDLKLDDGSGRPIILRQFEYIFPPGVQYKPREEDILTEGYIQFLKSQLYFADELDLIEKPRVYIDEKGFKIFATCQARKGSIIPGTAKLQTLTEIAQS